MATHVQAETLPGDTFSRVLACAISCCGVLLVVVPFMQWTNWSPAAAQAGTPLSVGGGNLVIAIAGIGIVVALMAFQALQRPTTWKYAILLLASITASVTSYVAASARMSATQDLANALVNNGCFSSCGVPDVHPGLGLVSSVLLATVAMLISLTGLLEAVMRPTRAVPPVTQS
jgi:hypothetical protein